MFYKKTCLFVEYGKKIFREILKFNLQKYASILFISNMYIFEVNGDPVPQKQPGFSCSCKTGKTHCYDRSKKDKEIIQWQIKPFAPKEPLCCPVELTIVFFLSIPKATSYFRRRQMIHRVILPDIRPDEDNLAYLITNSLTGIVYDDDKRVCAKHVYKFYGEDPKTIIKVRPILQMEKIGIHANDI